MTGRGKRNRLFPRLVSALALGLLLVAAGQGCHWGRQEPPPPPAATEPPPLQVPVPPQQPEPAGPAPAAPGEATEPAGPEEAPELPGDIREEPVAPEDLPSSAEAPAPEPVPETPAPEEPVAAAPGPPANGHGAGNGARRPEYPPARFDEPSWASSREELVYRVEFLGVTMGYARFTCMGKVMLGGRETYRLNVRAWTSGILSVIYPVNDTIDYYLDVRTLAPLRQDYSKSEKEKDNIVYYHQDTGLIEYRHKHNGSLRKKVEAAPNVYDPVSVAYYFRVRDLGAEDRPRNVYAGRKLWQISARNLGTERLSTALGPVDTVVVQPVIKRDGKLENKGDLRMWMTNDARHVPVRFYAKFKKIRMWTLVGELMPRQERG